MAFPADAVPGGRDVGVAARVEHAARIVVPLAWPASGRVPGRELGVQRVAQQNLEVPKSFEQGTGGSTGLLVETDRDAELSSDGRGVV